MSVLPAKTRDFPRLYLASSDLPAPIDPETFEFATPCAGCGGKCGAGSWEFPDGLFCRDCGPRRWEAIEAPVAPSGALPPAPPTVALPEPEDA